MVGPGPDIKKENLEWMMSDDIHPFSFLVCCRLAGYDPEGIRDGIHSILKRLKQKDAGA